MQVVVLLQIFHGVNCAKFTKQNVSDTTSNIYFISGFLVIDKFKKYFPQISTSHKRKRIQSFVC